MLNEKCTECRQRLTVCNIQNTIIQNVLKKYLKIYAHKVRNEIKETDPPKNSQICNFILH
jgi:hypothetical protein